MPPSTVAGQGESTFEADGGEGEQTLSNDADLEDENHIDIFCVVDLCWRYRKSWFYLSLSGMVITVTALL